MPFKSKSQLRMCFSRRRKGWNCQEWLKETDSVCNLPEKVGHSKTRTLRRGEKIVGPIMQGNRGGKYFVISEKDAKGIICEVKVYV